MKRHILTGIDGLNQAAQALGISARSISHYRSGREAVPKSLALVCLGWNFLQSQANPAQAAEATGD